MLRKVDYDCGCRITEDGIKLCDLHFAIFDLTAEELKKELSQVKYNQIVHTLNSEEQERKELYSSIKKINKR
jgi:hypothetical protein